jgi:hypothetical protein
MSVTLALPVGVLSGGYDFYPSAPSGYRTPNARTPVNSCPGTPKNVPGKKTPNARTPANSCPGTPKSGKSSAPGTPKRIRRGNTKKKTWHPEDAGHPSRGSKNHFEGKCRPCFAFNTPEGCPDGLLCNFCHYHHDVERVVPFLEEKIAKRQHRASIGDVEIVFMDEPMHQGSPCCDEAQCEHCVPLLESPDLSSVKLQRRNRRHSSAPANFLTFNSALPFLSFPEADQMDATPDLINRHVLGMVDNNTLAELLLQNQPDFYED